MGSVETKVIMNVKTFKDSFSLFRESVVECKNQWETSKNGMPLGMVILFSHDTQWVPSRYLRKYHAKQIEKLYPRTTFTLGKAPPQWAL
jgi:hypothetical protein